MLHPLGDGATTTALRPFSALMTLLAGVAPGLVDGVIAHTTPTGRVPLTMWQYLTERRRKLERMQRRDMPTGRVIFSNIDLPGDPPNKNAVE